ncbi:RDD family protein [Streptomyces sp. NPDC002514]|uniref:RDD family protein n=1 Tax=Streptomyces sp. NPDC001270 TaxID=3364554 RepID=UPI0036BAA342
MSAPTPAPGDDWPREGYYPDPSIPGYVRYWNGATWVPGTSRPAPQDGEPLAPPPGARPAAPAVEETGPHFFDEDPQPGPGGPEPASAWGADRARQTGFGGEGDHRVSWGADPRTPGADPRTPGADPRTPADPSSLPLPAARTSPSAPPDGRATSTDGTATISPADSGELPENGTFVFRRPIPGPAAAPAPGQGSGPADEGTMTFRPVRPRAGEPGQAGAPAGPAGPAFGPPPGPLGAGAGHAPGAAGSAGAAAAGIPAQGSGGSAAGPFGTPGAGGSGPAGGPGGPGFGPGNAAADRAAGAQAAGRPAAAQIAASPLPPQSTPVTTGPGGGRSSWAQQVQQLAGAGDEQPVAPWKPPVEDPFQAMARQQAAARPAGLGKRLAARLIDTVAVGAVTAVAAVPLGTKAADHIQEKVDAARLSGHTVTVWLLDGTTGAYLGIVLAVLLVVGVLYEVLPTAKWGRTLGKRLCGLQVRDIEGHEPPAFAVSLRRWLVATVPGLLGIGVIGFVWCLFDRPWHQCLHDKAAHTFVAG